MSRRRRGGAWSRATAVCALVLGAAGCLTPALEPSPPAWWTDPHAHDSAHLYFKARGDSSASLEAARAAALDSIRTQIAGYLFTEVSVSDTGREARLSVATAVDLREVESFREDDAVRPRGWTVWMLGRYPRAEYEAIRARLEEGGRLRLAWGEAQRALNAHLATEAERALNGILDSYDRALRVPFTVDEVRLELAGLYVGQGGARGKAKALLRDIANHASDARILARARDLERRLNQQPFDAREAFGDRLVGLSGWARRGGRIEAEGSLVGELNGRLAKYGVRTVSCDAGGSVPGALDAAAITSIAAGMAQQDAAAGLIVCLEVDPDRTGTTVQVPGGSPVEALDAKLSYWVVRVPDGAVLAAGAAAGFSRDVGAMVWEIVTYRDWLPAQAPAIAAGLGLP